MTFNAIDFDLDTIIFRDDGTVDADCPANLPRRLLPVLQRWWRENCDDVIADAKRDQDDAQEDAADELKKDQEQCRISRSQP